MARLKGLFFAEDETSTCIVVALTKLGVRERRESLATIRNAAVTAFGVQPEALSMAGSIVDGATIDAVSRSGVQRFLLPSGLLVVLLCVVFLRSWVLTGIIVGIGCFGQGVVLALVSAQGRSMNAILTVMPVLVFALTVSAGVHLANYFRDGITAGDADPSGSAVRRGWLPCALATLTTLVGLGSLSVSELTPIHDFSVLACLGIALTLVLLFLLLPAGMDLAPASPPSRPHRVK